MGFEGQSLSSFELRVSRRSFLQMGLVGAGASLFPLSACTSLMRKSPTLGSSDFLPVRDIDALTDIDQFSGDDFRTPHAALWDKAAYIASRGGIPEPSERVPLIVVGGGMSGLVAAYQLRAHRPVILEQASRLGGHAKGERWGSSLQSLGAAYICAPEKGTKLSALLDDLGLSSSYRLEGCTESEGSDVVLNSDGKLVRNFWSGSTDPKRAHEFQRARKLFEHVRNEAYPEIPFTSESVLSQDQLAALDRMTFEKWISLKLPKAHPHVTEFLEQYCWSSSGARMSELSAAQALSFLTADLGGIAVFPGGNSAITQAIASHLQSSLPSSHIRCGTLVVDVQPVSDGVKVTTVDRAGTLKAIHARACLVSSPKFVAKRFFDLAAGADSQIANQVQAMSKLNYRAYLVINVLLSSRLQSPSAELMVLRGKVPGRTERRTFTDLIFAGWASHDRGDRSAVTFYRPMPFSIARAELIGQDSFAKSKAEFENALPPVLSSLGVDPKSVASVRYTRWGHALPLGEPGLIASGVCATASRPIENRIFFSGQDNWANPCFETAAGTALESAALAQLALA
jgi:monoamine oxidase